VIAADDVAIKSGGPPRPPGPPRPAAPRPGLRGEGARGLRGTDKAAPPESTDAFEEGARPGLAGEPPARPRAPVAAGRSPALVQQSLDRLEREIREREGELGRLVAVLAREGFAREAAARHAKTLTALRKRLAEARARATKARRALAEIERGTGHVPSSRMGRLEAELSELEAETDDGRRALATLLLVAELAAEEPVRRLAVRGTDKAEALAYAERETPSTILADLVATLTAPTTAAHAHEAPPTREEPSAVSTPAGDHDAVDAPAGPDDLGALGRPLAGQQRLGRALRRRSP
jgi:DnaJ-domain-containing protein 1